MTLATTMFLTMALTMTVALPSATALDPVTTPGNPRCSERGLSGFKIEGVPVVGRYDLPGLPGAYVDVVDVTSGGRVLDWSSNFGLDEVIVKGSAAANIYITDDARSGTDFTAPKNSSGGSARISHVEFCYDGIETPTITADTEAVAGARGVAVDDVPLAELPASLVNLVAGTNLVNDAGTGLRFSDANVEYAGTGLRFSGTGLRFTGTGLRFSGTGLRFSGTSIRFSGTGLRFSGTGLRFTGTGLRFTDAGVGAFVQVRSAGTGLRFSGTGLRFTGTGMRFSDLPGWDVHLSDLQPPQGYTWDDVFVALGVYEGYPAQNVTFGQLLDELERDFAGYPPEALEVIEALASMSLLDLDPNGAVLRDVSLVGLLLGGTSLSNIPLPAGQTWCALIDPANTGCTDAEIGDTTVLGLNLAGLRSDNIPLDGIALDAIVFEPDSVLADLLDDSGEPGDLFVPAEPGDSLASYVLRGIDALNVPWEQLPLATDFDVRQYALGDRISFDVEWAQLGAATTPVQVVPPAGFVAAAEGVECVASSGTCVVDASTGDSFEFTVSGGTGVVDVAVTFSYRPSGLFGTATPPPSGGTFSITAGDGAGSFPVAVTDPWAGTDPPPIEADVLYFANAGGDDIDRYDVDVSEYAPGSHVAVRLSNLSNDADLVLYRSAGTGLRFSGTGMRFTGTGLRFSGTGLRFSGDSGDSGVDTLEPETLEDIPIEADRLVEDVSANRGATTPEAADGFTASDTTNFEVQVSGFNQATTDYVVRVAVTEFGDQCSAGTPADASVSFDNPVGANTAVLFAPSRFSADDQPAISAALGRLAAAWPITVGTVTTTGADWTAEDGFCSVTAANAVAEAVAADVQALAQQHPTIEHVMIIGGDDKLPMYRSADTTLIANEANYASTVGGQNPITSAFATQHILTDDIYGDDDPWPFLNRLYFTPERGVGRLVESTPDIVGQIDRFIGSNGSIDVERAFTAGYDFLSDVAVRIDENLADLTSDRSTLISDLPNGGVPDWNAVQLAAALDGGDDGASLSIASIEAHMDQGLLLTAFGDAQGDNPSPAEVVGPDDILPPGIDGAVLFTAGCHAGLNQPYADSLRSDDWAESLAGGPAAFYLANTGYGYGLDQPGIAYSEALLAEFSDLLELDGLTVGRATALAKQRFFADQIEIDPYDEKSQMQLVVYGVPMYSLSGVAPAAATPASTTPTAPDPVTGQPSAVVDVAATFAANDGADGTTFYGIGSLVTNGLDAETGFEASNGNPIQPKVTFDVTADDPALIARGALIEQMASSQVALSNPTIARATIDNTATESPAESGTYIFPTAFTNVHTEQSAGGARGRLVVVPAQYDSTDVGAEQLLIDSMRVRTYYASASDADVLRPLFRNVTAGPVGDDILFRVEIDDPAGTNITTTGVDRVLVQYFDGGVWHAVELFPANAAGTEWSGGLQDGLQLGSGSGVFFVQAVDRAGNVAVSANKGGNYPIDGTPARVVAFVSGDVGDEGWFVGVPTVELVGDAVDVDAVPPSHDVTLDTDPPFGYVAPFPITDEGLTSVRIDGDGATPISFDVRVDTQPPLVDLDQPISVVAPGGTITPAAIDVCSDPVPGSGLRDLDPGSVADCLLTSDEYSLVIDGQDPVGPFTLASALGRDVAGNSTSESQSAVILDGVEGSNAYFTSPVILGIIGGAADDAEVKLGDGDFVEYSVPLQITATTSILVRVGDDLIDFEVLVDTDGPTVTVAPALLPAYEIGSVQQIDCTFADLAGAGAPSGLASVQCGDATGTTETSLSATVDTSTLGEQTFVVSATDVAGNTTTQAYTYTVVDTIDPTVTVTPAPSGDYAVGAAVDVTCAFEDSGSGLASVTCGTLAAGDVSSLSTTLDTSTPGPRTFTATATDAAGNVTTRTFAYDVVDVVAPTVDVVPEPAGTYEIGAVVDVTCSFTDPEPGTGLATVACGDEVGGDVASLSATLDTSTPGPKAFTASATDVAGNTTTRTFTYEVIDTRCDPVGDASSPDADIVRCRAVSNSDGTATLSVIVDGDIALSGVQYRLRLASNPNKTGKQVKWVGGSITGSELLAVTVSGDRIDFLVDVDRVGVGAGETLYWFAEVQDGVSGNPSEGFLDRAPDDGQGWFELVI